MSSTIDRDVIPAAMAAKRQWVRYRIEPRAAGEKPTKMPYEATCARRAKSNDSKTWDSLPNAVEFVKHQRGRRYAGIGYMFAKDGGEVGIDLDGCRDPESGVIADWAVGILQSFRNTYAEVSPSRTGIKIFCRGKLPTDRTGAKESFPDRDHCGLEAYQHGRFFVVTGQRLDDHPSELAECQEGIDRVWKMIQEMREAKKDATKPKPQPRKTEPRNPFDTPPMIDAEPVAEGDTSLSRNQSRCLAYLRKCDDAISGQDGSGTTFHWCCECFKFGLSDDEAFALLQIVNAEKTGGEPWSDDELRHKLTDAKQAVEQAGEFGIRIKPEIKTGIDEMRVTDETIIALASRADLYQRGGVLVEVREAPESPECIVRPEGGVRAVTIPRPRLRETISDVAVFIKLKKTDENEEWVPTRVPQTVVEQVEARGVWRGIRSLEGIVTSPQFLSDGSILTSHGYDKRSGLYFADNSPLPFINQSPTRDDAKQACKTLLEVVADFPSDVISKAAWLASVLTGSARHAIDGPTPLVAIDANVRGSGKSLSADAVGIIHTGRQLPRTSASGDDNEFRKRITAILLAGEPLVLLDNVAGSLGCPSLDALLTSTTWTDRLLQESKMSGAIPATSIWIATGNNLQFQADTARRTLRIRLESREENPEERTGFRHPDLLAWVRRERGRLSAAAITILRAWHVAGRPDMQLPPWGSFDSWSRIIRHSLVWAGMADPGETRQEVQRESDREAGLLRMLLDAWEQADPQGHGMTVADALNKAFNATGQVLDVALGNVFTEMAGSNGKTNPRSIGNKLRHLRLRVCGGRYFDAHETRIGHAWKVCCCGSDGSSGSVLSLPTREIETHSVLHTRENINSGGGVPEPPDPPEPQCDHLNPSVWVRRDGKGYCGICNRFMGNLPTIRSN